jgi:hypothetical protein
MASSGTHKCILEINASSCIERDICDQERQCRVNETHHVARWSRGICRGKLGHLLNTSTNQTSRRYHHTPQRLGPYAVSLTMRPDAKHVTRLQIITPLIQPSGLATRAEEKPLVHICCSFDFVEDLLDGLIEAQVILISLGHELCVANILTSSMARLTFNTPLRMV